MIGGWLGMMIIPIILIAVVIYLIYNQKQKNNVKDNGSNDNSLDILNGKYARGEINEKRYNAKKNKILKLKL